MKTLAFNVLLTIGVLVIYSCHTDAKGIKIGGFKAPKPIPVPRPSIPKPSIPLIVPVPIILPVGGFGRNYYVNRNSRLQCYSCEGADNELCAVSPATSSRKVTCAEKNMFCSVVRKEVLIDSTAGSYNVTKFVDKTNETDIFIASTQNSSLTSSSTTDPLSFSTSTEFIISSSTENPMTTDASPLSIDSSTPASLTRVTREITTRVVIQRGCKSLDFIEGISLASISRKSGTNESEYVYAQLCTTDLCNSGDGRLRCYECEGTGQKDDCMVNPSKVAKVLMCQPKESCYVERKTVMTNSTSNSTETKIMVTRGCRAASSSDDQNVISRTNRTLGMSCRLTDFCNSFDANRLVQRTNSASGNYATFSSLILSFLTFVVSHLLIQK